VRRNSEAESVPALVESELESSQLNVVLNWFEELKRLVPTN
jgi:hypothetical protein